MDDGQRRVCFILNGQSGSCDADAASDVISRIADEKGFIATIHLLDKGSDIAELVKAARDSATEIIVAGGGDGTISAVASELVGTTLPLGVLPLGTLNHFAKDLLIPLTLEDAIKNVFDGTERFVDVGSVNGRIFLNNSGIGLYPSIVVDRTQSEKRGQTKWVALLQATIRKIAAYKLVRVTLKTKDDQRAIRATPFLFVGNNEYVISGLGIGARHRLDSGRLWICLAPRAGRAKLFVVAIRSVLGLLKEDDLEILQTTEIEVATRRRARKVSLDGEVTRLEGSLSYCCLPAALRVIAPRASASSDKA